MKSLIILFVKSVIAFCALFLIYVLMTSFDKMDLINQIIIPSLFFSISLVIFHIVFSILSGVKSDFSPNQTVNRKIEVDLDHLHNIIQKNTRWKLINKTYDCLIYKSTFESLKSFGETITIKKENTEVVVNSKPTLFTTIFDFGKNFENVKLVSSLL